MRDDSQGARTGVFFGILFVIAGIVAAFSDSDIMERLKYLLIFGGIGALIIWASLRKGPTPEELLRNERLNGIPSLEKQRLWIIGGVGSIFLFLAALAAVSDGPGVIRAIPVLVFLGIGVGISSYAFNSYQLFNKFGPTPLSLDPHPPCVGGQFGGSFEISLPEHKFSNAALTKKPKATAQLTCIKTTGSGKGSRRSLVWQEETDVYLQQSSKGYTGQLLLEIPEHVPATKIHLTTYTIPENTEDILAREIYPPRYTIQWTLKINADFGTELGKLKRSWVVELLDQSHDMAETKSSRIAIPDSFQEISEKAVTDRANKSALTQVQLTEENQYIHLISDANRHTNFKLAGIVGISFGSIFLPIGIFAVFQGWLPGYLFILIGTIAAIVAIFHLGKTIEVKIDKHTSVLHTRESWMRMVYSRTETKIQDLSKFEIKKTTSGQSADGLTEYYRLYFKTTSKKIRIADAIAGRKAAEALKRSIIEGLSGNDDKTI